MFSEFYPKEQRVIDNLLYRWPKSFIQTDSFGWPFQVHRPNHLSHAHLRLAELEAQRWMGEVEQLIFAQLRKPLSKIGSKENGLMYEALADALEWSDEDLEDFLQFSVNIPQMGGSFAENIAEKFPLSVDISGEEALIKGYRFDGVEVGVIIVCKERICLFYQSPSAVPSAYIPFRDVTSKELAQQYLFSQNSLQHIRFIDLTPEGGLMYVQANDVVEENTKHTYAECSSWFHPKLGKSNQVWLRVPGGIPGSKAPQRDVYPVLKHAYRYSE